MEGHSSAVYVLDLEQEQWSLAVSDNVLIPTPRDKMTGWTHKSRCYYFGGYGPSPLELPNPEQYLRNVGEFVIDGTSSFSWNNQLLIFDPNRARNSKWTLAEVGGSVPSARAACSSTYLPAYASILVFGGRCRTERLNDLYMLDLSSLVWTRVETTEVPVQPSGRSWCSVNALSSDQALVYGGLSNDSHTLSDSWRICIKRKRKGWYEGTWTAMDIASERRLCRHTGAV
ncbi:unnamed protein product, partial [Gongylonema pulchrum]